MRTDHRRAYDLIVGAGSACDPAVNLRRHNLRKYSMPIDWVVTGSLPVVTSLYRNRFAGFMELENLELDEKTRKLYENDAIYFEENDDTYDAGSYVKKSLFVRDKAYDILSVHDFPYLPGTHWSAHYPGFRERLHRRVDRLLTDFETSPSTLFVRWAGHPAEAIEFHSQLSGMTTGEVTVLLLAPSEATDAVAAPVAVADGVFVIAAPNRVSDPALWDKVLAGVSLRG